MSFMFWGSAEARGRVSVVLSVTKLDVMVSAVTHCISNTEVVNLLDGHSGFAHSANVLSTRTYCCIKPLSPRNYICILLI